ncbi:uncharacterized protein LOC143290740 [Babylonia areolata]|uniref:uncharacterized protein LOC143290740 n=1 Tax=Babylonia areolata TaxID=304850 RepID=UPI003FD352CA
MDTVTIVILIAVVCVIFKAVSWFLICQNATDESKRYRARQLVRLGRESGRSSALSRPRLANFDDTEKGKPLQGPVVMATSNVTPIPEDAEVPANAEAAPQPGDSSQEADFASESNPSTTNTTTEATAAEGPAASEDPDPDPDPDSDGSLNVMLPSAAGVGVVSMAIGGVVMAESAKTPGTAKAESPPVKVTPAPDFDDYKSLSPPRNQPPTYSPPSLPTPQYIEPPPPSPSTSRHVTLQRQKMVRRLQEQEGMDF